MSPNGLVLLDKPEGETSFQALGVIKRRLETRKVGHTGTLDRFASGLIVALSGRYTRLASIITGQTKTYTAVFRFGVETETLDPEGEVVGQGQVPTLNQIQDQVSGFVGQIDQVPPAFSAVHVGGQRAYRLARSGQPVILKARPVVIHRLDVLDWSAPELTLEISCSKGTYIRSLARDLGLAAGSRAYVTTLRRTQVGTFDVDAAVSPDLFDPESDLLDARSFVDKISETVVVRVPPEDREAVVSGRGLNLAELGRPLPTPTTCLLMCRDELLASVRWDGNRMEYGAVLAEPRGNAH